MHGKAPRADIWRTCGYRTDIALKAWLRRDELKLPAFYLLGDRNFLSDRARTLGLEVRFAEVRAEDASEAFADALPVVTTGHAATRATGPSRRYQRGCGHRLHSSGRQRRRCRAGQRGRHQSDRQERALPCRVSSSRPYRVLAELAAAGGRTPQPVIMLWSPALAVVPVTIHLPLRDAVTRLSRDLIVTTARIVDAALKTHFGLAHRASRSPASIPMPAKTARSAPRTRPSSLPRSKSCAAPASPSGARCRRTPCSMTPRVKPTIARSACITTRR